MSRVCGIPPCPQGTTIQKLMTFPTECFRIMHSPRRRCLWGVDLGKITSATYDLPRQNVLFYEDEANQSSYFLEFCFATDDYPFQL